MDMVQFSVKKKHLLEGVSSVSEWRWEKKKPIRKSLSIQNILNAPEGVNTNFQVLVKLSPSTAVS